MTVMGNTDKKQDLVNSLDTFIDVNLKENNHHNIILNIVVIIR